MPFVGHSHVSTLMMKVVELLVSCQHIDDESCETTGEDTQKPAL